jgi:hypothetical protein
MVLQTTSGGREMSTSMDVMAPAFVRRSPLRAANLEIHLANQRFAAERVERLYLASLLNRSDRLLDSLEELNLMNVPQIPELLRIQIATLVTALPFEYTGLMSDQSTPTQAIDRVFDVQEALLVFMTGTKTDDDDLQEAAS